MLVFLTPKIIRNPSDSQQVLNKSLDRRIDYIKSQGGVDPFGATMDEVQKRSTKVAPDAASPSENTETLQE
jgi:general secretion pathway protein D